MICLAILSAATSQGSIVRSHVATIWSRHSNITCVARANKVLRHAAMLSQVLHNVPEVQAGSEVAVSNPFNCITSRRAYRLFFTSKIVPTQDFVALNHWRLGTSVQPQVLNVQELL
ncbi:hypothetical protein COEREDRAFT_5481 [Coemansia reversa NRRL 1564]|uniref:Uncharacterized protein n=1 Tax=Coemansia reversa (strain ATCC 12441 / NRRL 1564) TaxID=763665 RepID=A0A2G5BL10_COERN|nr:hypothetical protein COEREDRAFT_5481 [Coemansia reversa NRRL 1564]|eukprot:PIA19662.1 hypothetical protein COEREDRAFT_5481 [Coemansia reversa NRRL 1564]